MKMYLYRVCWVRPYYLLLSLLGLCVLTVVISLLYLEDAALTLPHTRLQAAGHPALSALAQPLPQAGLDLGVRLRDTGVGLKIKDGAGAVDVLPKNGALGLKVILKDSADAAGVVAGDSAIAPNVIAGNNGGHRLGDQAAHSGVEVQKQAWPDHKKEKHNEVDFRADIKVLNSLEIVAYNITHKHTHNDPQKESERLGVVQKEGSIIIPPEVLAARPVSSSVLQPKRYIIYLCTSNITCCGWGDRQHGILSAYVISLATNRTFGVDMRSPCPLHTLFHPRLVDWKVNTSQLVGLSSRHIYAVNDRAFRQVMQAIDFDAVYTEDVIYLTTNYDYFYALKSNPHYTQLFRKKVRGKPRPLVFADLWLNIFKLNKRVRRRIDRALKLARPTPHHKLVCGHVRLGKNPSIPSDSEVRNTMQTIKPLWNFLAHFKDPKKYRIFVPSDSDLVRTKVLDMYPGQAVDVKGEIMHIDKLQPVEDACVGFEKVLADQYLLSMCDVLVLTYSVFGKSAAYMRRSNHDLYFMENGTIKPLQLFKEKT